MKYSMFESPLKVYGIFGFDKTKTVERVPVSMREKMGFTHLGGRTPGARLRFRTNSENLRITVKLEKHSPDMGMSMYACTSANVFVGTGSDTRFLGLVNPVSYEQTEFSKEFKKSSDIEDITILFPRNERVLDITVEIDDCGIIEEPTPYTHEKPMLFFGSSITEGGCCESVGNAYTSLVSKWLDSDYYNYGFSGFCKGQREFAELFSQMDLSLMVLDYDHNAPSAEFLKNTHEPFFKMMRKFKPTLPIVMMTAPNYEHMSEADERRAIIKATYDNAVKSGDNNVYFIDGKDFFGDTDREMCTVDGCHPNDLGFYRMAKVVYPVLKEILEK
ncbi:MAG: hypothetical protein IJB86_09380 [Clostridia bacterium]|nr:hypothetical protein [Clostridia bacterium]